MGNSFKQGGQLSPLLFNIYIDSLSVQLHKQLIGCSLRTMAVNHLIYADDLLLLAPSRKVERTINITLLCCTYGW